MRGRLGMFPEYQTSADDLCFVSAEPTGESLALVRGIVELLEADRRYQTDGEPQLGERGPYRHRQSRHA